MLSIERQRAITDILLEKKSVAVAELAERFQVSFETIRRDLKALEAEGVVERCGSSASGAVRRDHL
jgi:DeoR family fructose operon transcriptional repressor